jgi:uncharacterized protein YndB with AHSA1/START domain
MTSTPDVPLRLELTYEVPGTPEQVWDAIATANGISSWFLPTDVDERLGGAITFHMGDDVSSSGTVTAWDPPSRVAYVEPNWAELTGHDAAEVTPLATEFLVEATSGGSCVVRVVSSAFGSGAEWEREFFAEMETGWRPFFENLRLYLSEFPGQRVTSLSAQATVPAEAGQVFTAMRNTLGAGEVGRPVEVHGLRGDVHRLGDHDLLLRLSEPIPGYAQFTVFDQGGTTMAQIEGYLFSPEAAAYVERERPAWKAWLEGLMAPAGAR